MADKVTKGSCNCGEFKYQFTGEPLNVALCHCKPCQKTAGSNGSVNVVVPNDAFKVLAGKTEVFSRPGETGKDVHCNFCVKCHTFMTVNADSIEGLTIVKAGTIDGEVLASAPVVEIYNRNRPGWLESKEGRGDFDGAPS